jgi:hypothetical protein
MSSKLLKEKIANEFSEFMGSYGYIREKKSIRWLKHQPFGWDDVLMGLRYRNKGYTMELVACRRFEAVESILGSFFQKPNHYRNDGTAPTLAFCGNIVDKINYITRGYVFSVPDYEDSFNHLKVDFLTKVYPVLEQTDSLEKLNNFINNPPETFDEKVYFFPLDGGTLFRKMIIANLIDKNYEEVCLFVFTRLSEAIASGENISDVYDYLQIYHDLKNHLNHHVQPLNV